MNTPAPQALLWTGGWDSTYRLLELLLGYRLPVQTYYLIDPGRRSWQRELAAMLAIRQQLQQDFSYTQTLLLPTFQVEITRLQPDPEIQAAFETLHRDFQLGTQYHWLARFCRQAGLAHVDTGIEAHGWSKTRLLPLLEPFDTPAGVNWRMAPAHAGQPLYTLLHTMTFPLYRNNKRDLLRQARARGWLPIMQLTWFCHTPVGNGQPCGRCAACQQTLEQGLGWRLPLPRRALGQAQLGLHWLRYRARSLAAMISPRNRRKPAPLR